MRVSAQSPRDWQTVDLCSLHSLLSGLVVEVGAVHLPRGGTAFFVRDNGAGFRPELASRPFHPFKRLHSGKEFEGTGIGLATVRRIVERHQGSVWAESPGPGKGATFFFRLLPFGLP